MTRASLPVLKTEGTGASRRGSHQLATVMKCPRKWQLRYRSRIREAKEKRHTKLGTLHHYAIGFAYAERVIQQGVWPTPTWWTGAPLKDELERIGEGWPSEINLALEMYHAYQQHWWHGMSPELWEPVAVEEQFWGRVGDIDPQGDDDPLRDEIVTCGTDLVVRNTRTQQLWIVDHKSKGFDPFVRSRMQRMEPWVRQSTGGGDHEQYNLFWQGLVNLHLVRRAFPDEVVAGFIINRMSRDKTNDGSFLFDRHTLHTSPRVYETAPRVIRHAVAAEAALTGMVDAGEKLAPHYWECHGKYGACEYLPVCNADDDVQMQDALQAHFTAV